MGASIVAGDLRDGQHRNDTANVRYFTTAFFHHSVELAEEVPGSGFVLVDVFAVEGPGAMLPDFARRWADPASRERLLALVRGVESEPSLIGTSRTCWPSPAGPDPLLGRKRDCILIFSGR